MYIVQCMSNGQNVYETVPTSGTIVLQLQSHDLIVHFSFSGFGEPLDSFQNNGSNSSFSQYSHENSHSMGPINDDLDIKMK
jgi:hypothetical protein